MGGFGHPVKEKEKRERVVETTSLGHWGDLTTIRLVGLVRGWPPTPVLLLLLLPFFF
jgi:hypothetical protein